MYGDLNTVGEFKKWLSQFEDDEKVVIAVRSYYKQYPIEYLTPSEGFHVNNEVRISCSLGERFRIQELKNK